MVSKLLENIRAVQAIIKDAPIVEAEMRAELAELLDAIYVDAEKKEPYIDEVNR